MTAGINVPIELGLAGLRQQVASARTIFAQLLPNIALVNRALTTLQGIGITGIFNTVRYQNWVVLSSIVKDMLPTTSLLGQQIGRITVGPKLFKEITIVRQAWGFFRQELAATRLEVQQLSQGVIASAANLSAGGGFLMPGQLPAGPTLFNAFERQQGVEQFVGFDKLAREYQGIQRIRGESQAEIDGLTDSVLDASRQFAAAPEETVELANALTRLGLSASESAANLEPLAGVAIALGESMTVVAESVEAVSDAYSLPIEQFGATADKLGLVAVTTGASIGELTTALEQAAPAAIDSGQSFEEVLATVAALGDKGRSASQAGSGVQNFLLSLRQGAAEIPPVADAAGMSLQELKNVASSEFGTPRKGAALALLGLTKDDLLDTEGQIRPLFDLIPLLQEKVGQLQTTADGAAKVPLILNAVFGKKDAATVNALLATSREELTALRDTIEGAEGFGAGAAEESLNSLSGSIDTLANTARLVSIQVGSFFAPLIKQVVDGASWLLNLFLALPAPMQMMLMSLNLLLPLMILYWHSLRATVYFKKALAVATYLYSNALTVEGRALLVSNATGAVAEALTRAQTLAKGALATVTGVLTGQITLQAFAQKVWNATFLTAKAVILEYAATTKGAIALAKAHLLAIAQFAAVAGGLIYTYSELTRRSKGWQAAEGIREATAELTKFREEMDRVAVAGGEQTTIDKLLAFGRQVKSEGLTETMRDFLNSFMPPDAQDNSDYGKQAQGLIDFLKSPLLTGRQLGAQESMRALEEQINSVGLHLDKGQGILRKYGLEFLDANDKTRLGADGIRAFSKEADEQIKLLEKTLETLQQQQPVTETQQALQQASIAQTEQQINLIRTRVRALQSETIAQGQIVLTLDEVIKKYKELEHSSDLENLAGEETIERDLANQEITLREASDRRLAIREAENIRLQQLNKQAIDDLKAAMIGASPEDLTKINEELSRRTLEGQRLRIDGWKIEQEQIKAVEDALLEVIESQANFAKAGFEARNAQLGESQARLNNLNTLEQARSKLIDTQATLEKQRLDYQLELAELSGDETAIAESKADIFEQQLATLESQQLKARELLNVQRYLRANELAREEISARIALLDSQIAVQKAQARNATAQEITLLQQTATLRNQQLQFIAEQRTRQNEVNQLEYDALQTQQIAAREALEQSRAIELQRTAKQAAADAEEQRQEREQERQKQLEAAQEKERERLQQLAEAREKAEAERQKQLEEAQRAEVERLQAIKEESEYLAQIEEKRFNLMKTNAQNQLLKAQIAGGIGGAEALAALQERMAREEIKINENKFKEIQRLLTEQVIDTKEAASRRLDIEQSLAQSQGQLLQATLEKQKRALERQASVIRLPLEFELGSSDSYQDAIGKIQKRFDAEIGVINAVGSLEKQRLDYQLQLAELNEENTKVEQLKKQIFDQQFSTLQRQQEAEKISLELSQRQNAIEQQRQITQAKIALVESQIALAKGQTEGLSDYEMRSLLQVADLRSQALVQAEEGARLAEYTNQLERERLAVEQLQSKEQMQIAKNLEEQNKYKEQLKLAEEKGTPKPVALKPQQLQFSPVGMPQFSPQSVIAQIGAIRPIVQRDSEQPLGALVAELKSSIASLAGKIAQPEFNNQINNYFDTNDLKSQQLKQSATQQTLEAIRDVSRETKRLFRG